MTADQTTTDLIGVLEKFCSAFERRDADAVMRLVASDPALIVGTSGTMGWLLAEGWETAATAGRTERNAYRMTMAFRRQAERWVPVLIHGSSPHQP